MNRWYCYAMPTSRRTTKPGAENTRSADPAPNLDGFWEDGLILAVAQLVVGKKRQTKRLRSERPARKT